ncbi:hypothetical protein FRB99_007649 [Tulasnella sp. 403]|nr:hypothetical protein FRB99_007649 [Tulasnella sp. 403]
MSDLPDIASLALGAPFVSRTATTSSESPFPESQQPYSLAAFMPKPRSRPGRRLDYNAAAYFAWDESTFDGPAFTQRLPAPLISSWKATTVNWKDSVAICGGNCILVMSTSASRPISLRQRFSVMEGDQLVTIVWAVDPSTLHPLVLCAGRGALIYIVDVITGSSRGTLRGHGGPITSLAVDPKNPFLFASTSRDLSVRLYDLTLDASSFLPEAYWPQSTSRQMPVRRGRAAKQASAAPLIGDIGAPFGGGIPDGEGTGIGKCVAIFAGDSADSGGHKGTVCCAAFHPTRPFIVTCGVDNSIKIWRLPYMQAEGSIRKLHVDDKPVFSSQDIHESWINSIHWLSDDILLSKSCGSNGTLVIWKWLELQRFSPRDPSAPVRNLNKDYNDSRSWTTLARGGVPAGSGELHTQVYKRCPEFQTGVTLALPSTTGRIYLWNLASILPHDKPPFPSLTEVADEEEQTSDAVSVLELEVNGAESDSNSDGPVIRPNVRKRQRIILSPAASSASDDETQPTSTEETHSSPAMWEPSEILEAGRGLASSEFLNLLGHEYDDEGYVPVIDAHCIALSPAGLDRIVFGGNLGIGVWAKPTDER